MNKNSKNNIITNYYYYYSWFVDHKIYFINIEDFAEIYTFKDLFFESLESFSWNT